MGSKRFVRKEKRKKSRLTDAWRRPKGHQNKQRLQHKAHTPKVKPGFGTKSIDKNHDRNGLKIITVRTKDDLKNINPKTDVILIARVGKRNKLAIIEEAQKLNIKIHNLNVVKYKAKADEELKKKKDAAKQRDKKQVEKEKQAKKEDKKSEKKEEKTLSEEEKKKLEKEEKDKILTKAK